MEPPERSQQAPGVHSAYKRARTRPSVSTSLGEGPERLWHCPGRAPPAIVCVDCFAKLKGFPGLLGSLSLPLSTCPLHLQCHQCQPCHPFKISFLLAFLLFSTEAKPWMTLRCDGQMRERGLCSPAGHGWSALHSVFGQLSRGGETPCAEDRVAKNQDQLLVSPAFSLHVEQAWIQPSCC